MAPPKGVIINIHGVLYSAHILRLSQDELLKVLYNMTTF